MRARLENWIRTMRLKLAEFIMDKRDLAENKEASETVWIIANKPGLGYKFLRHIMNPTVVVEWKINDIPQEERIH